MTTVDILYRRLCGSLLISPANYGGCDLKLAGRAHSQADYIETCAVRLNGG